MWTVSEVTPFLASFGDLGDEKALLIAVGKYERPDGTRRWASAVPGATADNGVPCVVACGYYREFAVLMTRGAIELRERARKGGAGSAGNTLKIKKAWVVVIQAQPRKGKGCRLRGDGCELPKGGYRGSPH